MKLISFSFLIYIWLSTVSSALGQNNLHLDSITTLAARYFYTHPDSAQYVLHEGIKLAEAAGNSYKKGIFLNKLISQKTRIKDWDSARYYFKKSKSFLEQHDISVLIPDVHSEIAESFYYMEKLDSALYHFEIADSLYEKNQDSIGVLISKNNKANVFQIQGNYKEAILNLLEAVKNVDTTQYLYIKVELYQNIAQLYGHIDEDEAALEYAEQSLNLALKNPNYPQDVVNAYCLRARHFIKKKEFLEATKDIQDAEKWISENQLSSVQYKVSSVKGNFLVAQAKYMEALPFLEEAIRDGEKNNLNDFELFSLRKNLAFTYRKLGQLSKGKGLVKDMLKAAEENHRVDNQVELYKELAQIQISMGNDIEAYSSLENHIRLKDSVLGIEKQQIIKDAMVRYQTLEKEKELLETQSDLDKTERQNLRLYGGLGITLLLAILAYLFYNQQRLKNRQLKKEAELREALARIETQNKLQEQRLRISRDLHDNIGSQLTFITSSLDSLQYRMDDEENPVSQRLASIRDFTTHTIYELRDTIWAMNKESISAEDLKARIMNFLNKAGESKQSIEFKFENFNQLSDKNSLPSVMGMNVYRIIQEAVNNSLKYAKPQNIKVELSQLKNQYELKISDDGVGFEVQTTESGNGLNNIRKRAKDIGGKVAINSEIGKGTIVEVQFPIP